jgi:hypothetical protein
MQNVENTDPSVKTSTAIWAVTSFGALDVSRRFETSYCRQVREVKSSRLYEVKIPEKSVHRSQYFEKFKSRTSICFGNWNIVMVSFNRRTVELNYGS